MPRLRDGSQVRDRRLARLKPSDWKHYERFPLTAETEPTVPTPVVLGVGWYSSFDRPQLEGRMYWVGRGKLGYLRGGHCVCVKNTADDPVGWWDFYNQGVEGSCVGFGSSRAMSLLNRRRYGSRWLYWEAQKIDPWAGGAYAGAQPIYEGTDVRSAMEILRLRGHRWVYRGIERPEALSEGIERYRWSSDAQQVIQVCGHVTAQRLGAVPFLNSWGRGPDGYPHFTWMPGEVLQRLLDEDGEAAIPVDR